MNSNGAEGRLRILSIPDDLPLYGELFGRVGQANVYALPSYLKHAPAAESHPIIIALYSEKDKIAMRPYVKRCINDLPVFRDLPERYWDIASPYEYSTVMTNGAGPEECGYLCAGFHAAMAKHCAEDHIVCEFVRFDPFLSPFEHFSGHYDMTRSCDNIYIDLRKGWDELRASLHKSVKKNIRRAESARLSFAEVDKTPENVDIFIGLYSASMRRLQARGYYYFSGAYFKALLRDCEGSSLFIISDAGGRPVAASIVLQHGGVAHHHLTGYEPEAQQERPNDYMIYSLMQWGKKSGLQTLHLGGGSDSIRTFKSKFSNTSIPYYVGYRIYDKRIYESLCAICRQAESYFSPSGYFPLYRMDPQPAPPPPLI